MEPLTGTSSLPMPDLRLLLVRLGEALLLGGLLAWRPLSRLAGGRSSKPDIGFALVLMTLASSLAIVIIGDSLARAFGIVGLGSFVRFRSSIKDPTDVVLFFAAIAVGMACGLGAAVHAAVGVVALSLVLILRDCLPRAEREAAPVKADFRKVAS